jgi:CMP-N,N'-diacetyllegionaminic acid synthase
MKNDIICFVPAKKKSSLKNKNMVLINKKPLLYYTLISAKKSKYLKEIFVSSDSDKILNYSKKLNVNIIKRPKKLSTNIAKGYEVISQFISKHDSFLKNKSILVLQPSSPLRTTNHINKAIHLHYKFDHKTVISVKKVNRKFLKSFIHKQNKLYPLDRGKYIQQNRQNLPEMCIPNGAIFLFSVKDFKKKNKVPYDKSIPMFMSEKESIDLDTKQDLIEIKKRLKKNV